MIGRRPTEVTVDGFDLNGGANDVRFELIKVTGWWGTSATVEGTAQARQTIGLFREAGRRGGRLVTIEGRVVARDRQTMTVALGDLDALLADGGFGVLRIDERSEGARTAVVRLAGPPDVDWNGGLFARYQLQLQAPDPFRYGETREGSTTFPSTAEGVAAVWPAFGGGVFSWGAPPPPDSLGVTTVTNLGTADADPVFTVVGPVGADGFRVTDVTTGHQITYLGDVPDGSTLVVDTARGTATINGSVDRTSSLLVSRWPQIGRRATHEFLFQPLGDRTDAVLSVGVTATYW